MVGRGTRPLTYTVDHLNGADQAGERKKVIASSAKPDCLLFDFVGNSGRHKLITPVDLLAGQYNEDVAKKAKKLEIDPENEGKDPKELLEMARAEILQIARALKSRVNAWDKEFNPFSVLHVQHDTNYQYGDKAASEKMRDYLVRSGMEKKFVDSLSHREARKLQKTIWIRLQKGLASFGQLAVLKKYGINKINIRKSRASAAIDYIKSTKGNPSTIRLNAIVYDRHITGEDG
jgi:hypothetical protein